MLSFFIQINKLGYIEQVIWSDPDDIVSDGSQSIFQLFAKEAKSVLLNAMKRSSGKAEASLCDVPLRLRDRPIDLSLSIVPTRKNYLVFAAEQRPSWEDERNRGYQTIVLMFMNIMKSLLNSSVSSGGKLPANEQTEMIQTLVSELRNRKQLLEEANTKLSSTNQDLSNRLVKDSLTGLVNRYQYRSEIEFLIGRNPGKLGIFVFIDIDNFKSVNDQYGHAAGDRYLVEFSERLKRLPVGNMVRIRISGDEFGLFVSALEDCGAAAMEQLWHEIQAHVLSLPIEINGYKIPITVSAGMSVYGKDTIEIHELVEYADNAMYCAKRKGKNRYCVYTKTQSHSVNLSLERTIVNNPG